MRHPPDDVYRSVRDTDPDRPGQVGPDEPVSDLRPLPPRVTTPSPRGARGRTTRLTRGRDRVEAVFRPVLYPARS